MGRKFVSASPEMSKDELDILKRALARERAARKQAEKILEVKSAELFSTTEQLKQSNTKLEKLVKEKTSQLEGIFENIIDAYVVMDLKGNVLKMNEAAEDLFGHQFEDEDLNVMSLIYRDDLAYAMNSFEGLMENGFFADYQARIFTKDRKVKWVQINASLVYDEDNKPIAAQGIVRNITEAKANIDIIEEQKRELGIIVENSSLGIVLTENGNLVKVNKSFQDLLGYSADELLNLTIKDISFPEDFPQSQEYLIQLDAGEIDSFVIDKRYRKKDGSIVWAKTNVNAVRSAVGDLKFQVAMVEDITSSREKALMLEVLNEVAKAILGKVDIEEIAWEITNKISTYLGSDDCVIYLVREDKNLLEQISAMGDKVINRGVIKDQLTLQLGEGIVGNVAQTGVAEIIKDTSKDPRYVADDMQRLSEITIPIVTDGKVIGVIDSEHSEKDYYTREHLETLENIARLVAMQLKNAINLKERRRAEQKNIQLLTQLEKSNNELEEYAHVVSHDLKSPLRSIYALIDWISEDNQETFDVQSKENVAHIKLTLEKMENLISEILNYSSINSELMEYTMVDLNLILEETQKTIHVPAHINIEVAKLPSLKGDRIRLQQLFQNLISNAIRYNDKEDGFIQIDFKEETKHFLFIIKDNGIGIEERYHQKIFKMFQSLNVNKDSTGVGLAIVKKIVELHHGKIWLESKLEKGTTFYFTLRKN